MKHAPTIPTSPAWTDKFNSESPGACRVFWCYGSIKGEITVIAITPHPQA